MPSSGANNWKALRVTGAAAVLAAIFASPAFAAQDQPTDYSGLDSLSRFAGSSHSSVQEFAKVSETLVDVRRGAFAGMGTGSTQRGLARGWNQAFDPWRKASASTKNSMPFKAAPGLFMASDITTSVIAPLTVGDLKGATAGAVNVAVSNTAANAGTAAIGAFGTGAGMVVGSFVPVIGTAVGGMVGGAIGSVVGGYISYSAYDIYIKQHVVGVVEGGLAAIFDPDTLTQAMRAREERLRLQAALDLKPEWDRLHRISEDFDMSSVELVSPPTIFYRPGTPGAGDVPPTSVEPVTLTDLTRLSMKVWDSKYPQYPVSSDCIVAGATLKCRGSSVFENWVTKTTFDGQIAGNTAAGVLIYSTQMSMQNCEQTWAGQHHERYEFNQDGTLRAEVAPHSFRLTFNSCEGTVTSTASSPWKVLPGSWSARQ